MGPKPEVRRGIPDVEVAVLSSDDSEIDCWAPTKVGELGPPSSSYGPPVMAAPPSFAGPRVPPRLFTANAQQPRAFAPPGWTESVPSWVYALAIACGVFVLGSALVAARLL